MCSLFPPFGDPWPSCLLPSQQHHVCSTCDWPKPQRSIKGQKRDTDPILGNHHLFPWIRMMKTAIPYSILHSPPTFFFLRKEKEKKSLPHLQPERRCLQSISSLSPFLGQWIKYLSFASKIISFTVSVNTQAGKEPKEGSGSGTKRNLGY